MLVLLNAVQPAQTKLPAILVKRSGDRWARYSGCIRSRRTASARRRCISPQTSRRRCWKSSQSGSAAGTAGSACRTRRWLPAQARLQSADLFCFWIRYEAPTADRGSHGAPWLCQPNPASIVPKTVMPCHVSWQFVSIKPQRLVHASSAEASVAAEAPVGTMSPAHASPSQETPAAARITAAC
jgi:hypothetical protein